MPVPEPVRLIVEQNAPVPTEGNPDGPVTLTNRRSNDAVGCARWCADKLRCHCQVNVTPGVTNVTGVKSG